MHFDDAKAQSPPRAARVPPCPQTKFRAPLPVRNWIRRRRVLERISASNCPFLLIHAPAGFGKSTLAAQWLAELVATRGHRTAWLGLDADDNNVLWFLSHLLEAIRPCVPDLGNDLASVIEEYPDDAERHILPILVNAIERSANPVTIALDDWHLITDERARAALSWLLENAGAQMGLVITSRTKMGLPLARLKMLGTLLEVDSNDLRFDGTEIGDFLASTDGVALGADDIAKLQATTDGWVAALQLVALSLDGGADPHEFIKCLSGRNSHVAEYLTENVLDTLPEEVRDTLLYTSVAERLSAGLVTALTGRPKGQATLEAIHRRNLFLQPLDDHGDWFRYHHMFNDFLRRRLERDEPGKAAELHRTAARWYDEHDMPSEAVHHALQGGAIDVAAAVVRRHARVLVEQSKMATFLGLIQKLPVATVEDDAELQVVMAWASCLLHKPEMARVALDRVNHLDRDAEPDVRADRELECLVIEACVDMYADRMHLVETMEAQCFPLAERLRPWVVSVGANIATFRRLHTFRFDEALEVQRWATPFHEATTGCFSRVYGRCFAGIALRELGRAAEAERRFSEALDLGRTMAGRHSHAARLAGALLAEQQYVRGVVGPETVQLLEDCRELGDEAGVVDYMMADYATLARYYCDQQPPRTEAAGATLDQADRIAAQLELPRLAARVRFERALLGVDVDRITIPEAVHGVDEGLLIKTTEYNWLAETILGLRLGMSPERARPLIDEVGELAATMESQGRLRAGIQVRLLQAAVRHAAGDLDAATRQLHEVGETCEQHGDIHSPRIWGRLMGLRLVVPARPPVAASPQPEAEHTPVEARFAHLVTLSSRERQIVALLAQGMTNKEVAAKLHIGINTVKWHLKNVFALLGVTRRQECVNRARELQLIP